MHPVGCGAVADAETLVTELTARLRPVELDLGLAWWEASTHASDDANRRKADRDVARRRILADPAAFDAVRAAREAPDADGVVRRQLDVLHDAMIPNQIDDEIQQRIVELETEVEATFTSFRGKLDGARVADNAILDILRTSDDTDLRRRAWEASKQVGAAVAHSVRELARLRNDAARALGYRDHFALALTVGEMDEARLVATLDEVDRHTAEPFRAWKGPLDDALAARFDVSPGELAPWHLDDPFFQDPPTCGAVELDPLFADAALATLTVRPYAR